MKTNEEFEKAMETATDELQDATMKVANLYAESMVMAFTVFLVKHDAGDSEQLEELATQFLSEEEEAMAEEFRNASQR